MVSFYEELIRRKRSHVYVVYPMYKNVSFSFIGENHYRQLKRFFKTYSVDESTFPLCEIVSYPVVYLHPYFYVMERESRRIERRKPYIRALIGVDVADGDHITKKAVELTDYATAMVVPSNFARNTYVNSGVKVPVHVVPHGVHENWLDEPPREPDLFKPLAKEKAKKKYKVLLAWILHSPFRKGLDILIELYKKLVNERTDVILVLKTMRGAGVIPRDVKSVGGVLEDSFNPTLTLKWLSEREKMELYDQADLFLLTSRGGGFELSGLEALARGVPVIAPKGGSWDDYMPDWGLTPSKRSPPVLEGNPIHDGCGVEMLIDKAVDKAINILNNLDEYKAKTKEYTNTRIRREFTWDRVGEILKEVTQKYI